MQQDGYCKSLQWIYHDHKLLKIYNIHITLTSCIPCYDIITLNWLSSFHFIYHAIHKYCQKYVFCGYNNSITLVTLIVEWIFLYIEVTQYIRTLEDLYNYIIINVNRIGQISEQIQHGDVITLIYIIYNQQFHDI